MARKKWTPESTVDEIGPRIEALVRSRGFTGPELGRRTGLVRQTIYNAFRVDANPPVQTVAKILKAIGANWSDLDPE